MVSVRLFRWFGDGKIHTEATKERTWAGAERAKQAKLHTWEEEELGKAGLLAFWANTHLRDRSALRKKDQVTYCLE